MKVERFEVIMLIILTFASGMYFMMGLIDFNLTPTYKRIAIEQDWQCVEWENDTILVDFAFIDNEYCNSCKIPLEDDMFKVNSTKCCDFDEVCIWRKYKTDQVCTREGLNCEEKMMSCKCYVDCYYSLERKECVGGYPTYETFCDDYRDV